jgi:hypothetical protein
MFGINDSNQKNNSQGAADPPAPLPPSPFMDNPSSAPEPSGPAASAPSLPDIPPINDDSDTPAPPAPPTDNNQGGDLVGLKTQALNSLAPLVGHLDQTPEEKFKTTMMLIQASDNSQLVKDAYEIANQIPDEKVRAQALLDVVNEINYFTQKDKDEKKA